MKHRMSGLPAASLGLALTLCAPALHAGAVTDGTVGAAGVVLSGKFTVPPTLGTQRGGNLFQSFQRFGIQAGESATFQSGDASVRQVIVRVTGGLASQIDGPLKLEAPTGSAPGLWFMNPSGIGVGPTGSFDVPGSLRLSTAPSLQFADGTRWLASTVGNSTLSAAEPRAFGFVGSAQAAPLVWTGGKADLAQGDIELSAGAVTLDGAQITAQGGISLAAVGGDVVVRNGSQLSAQFTSDTAGIGPAVSVNGQNVTVSESSLTVQTQGPTGTRGGSVDIKADASFKLLGDALIGAYANGAGDAGTVRITAADVLLAGRDGSDFWAGVEAFGLGAVASAGQVLVQATGAVLMREGGFLSAGALGSGAIGLIDVRSASLSIDGATSGLFGSAFSDPAAGSRELKGSGADIRVQTSGELRVVNSGWITSDTETDQKGGSITLRAGSMALSGLGSVQSNSSGAGDSGAIDIQVTGTAKIDSGAYVSTDADGSGAGGAITIAAGQLQISGAGSKVSSDTAGSAPGGSITMVADSLRLDGGAVVSAKTAGAHAGGNLSLAGNDITLAGGATLSTDTSGAGDGGHIDVGTGQTRSLTLDGAQVQSNASSDGFAGFITLQGTAVDIVGRSEVLNQSTGRGEAGFITVVGTRIRIDGQSSLKAEAGADTTGTAGYIRLGDKNTRSLVLGSGVEVSARTEGEASDGQVALQADEVVLNNASVDASTSGFGRAGDVTVTAGTLTLTDKSEIKSSADDLALGDAGRVTVTVSGALVLRDSGLLAYNDSESASNRPEDSGVKVRAGSLLMDNSTVLADALGGANGGHVDLHIDGTTTLLRNSLVGTSAASGDGGLVSVTSGGLLLLRQSLISTSVEERDGGNGGDIRVQAPSIVMRSAFIQANTQAAEAKGGLVSIQTGLLLPDGSNLRLGGDAPERFVFGSPAGLNVIQAVAPDGVSGELNVTQPELNVAAALASLRAAPLGGGRLSYDLCEIPNQSGLSVLTRGRLYPAARGVLSPRPAAVPQPGLR